MQLATVDSTLLRILRRPKFHVEQCLEFSGLRMIDIRLLRLGLLWLKQVRIHVRECLLIVDEQIKQVELIFRCEIDCFLLRLRQLHQTLLEALIILFGSSKHYVFPYSFQTFSKQLLKFWPLVVLANSD